ncbi:cation transporter [Campylobacterota bacterium]|nr:cation transporter [Campylobacterota bacterium]
MALSIERRSTMIASACALAMAVLKCVVGVATGSMAVLSSAIDSLLDMAMSVFNTYALKNAEMAADTTFNYGRGKMEGLAALVEGGLIALSGAFIIYQSVSRLIDEREVEALGDALVVMIVCTAITLALVLYLAAVLKRSNSLIIRSDLLHYKSDLWTNLGIIVSLALVGLTGWHSIDAIVSIAIACVITYGAYKIVRDGVLTLLDRAIEEPLYSQIVAIVENAPRVSSYHYLRTRRSAKTSMVDVHLVFNEAISLKDAHTVSELVEEQIAALDTKAKWLITVHLDPCDDSKDD